QGDQRLSVDPRRPRARQELAFRRHHRARLPDALAPVPPLGAHLRLLRPENGRQLRPEPRAVHLAAAERLARARALHAAEIRKARRRRYPGHLEHPRRARRIRQTGARRRMARPPLLLNRDRPRFMNPRWKNRPSGSNWGDFGPDDQRGRMNLVTREKVLQGIAEVKEGITFCCSLPLDYPGGQVLNPRRAPPRLAATSRDGKQFFCRPLFEFNENMTDVICDDQVLMSLQYSTQWDSFAHVGGRFDADGDGKPELV